MGEWDQPPIKLDRSRPVWQQQKAEGSKAYAWFMAFCKCGPGRTLPALYKQAIAEIDRPNAETRAKPTLPAIKPSKSGKHPRRWDEWRRRYRWNERVQSYDYHMHEQEMVEEIEQRKRMRALRIDASQSLIEFGLSGLQALKDRVEQDGDFRRISAQSLVNALKDGIRELREDYGDVQPVKVQHAHALVHLDERQLEELDSSALIEVYKQLGSEPDDDQ